jgi:hypothetical protein
MRKRNHGDDEMPDLMDEIDIPEITLGGNK